MCSSVLEYLDFRGVPVTVPAASVVHRDRHTARGGASTEGGVTQTQLFHATQMQCTADLAPVMCWHT